MKVLVASSNRDLLSSLINVLNEKGCETKEAFDGVLALSALAEESFDLFLIDKNIQRLEYNSLIKRIRDKDIKIPVLLIVDNAKLSYEFLSSPALADEYLTSPFHIEKLMTRIQEVYDSSKEEKVLVNAGNVKLTNKFYYLEAEELIHISLHEFKLMKLLIANFEKEVSYEELFPLLKNNHDDAGLLWTYMLALNKKLTQINANVAIESVTKKGYKLVKKND